MPSPGSSPQRDLHSTTPQPEIERQLGARFKSIESLLANFELVDFSRLGPPEREHMFGVRREILGDMHCGLFTWASLVPQMRPFTLLSMFTNLNLLARRFGDLGGLCALAARKLLTMPDPLAAFVSTDSHPSSGQVYRYVSTPNLQLLWRGDSVKVPPAFYRMYSCSMKGSYAEWNEGEKFPDKAEAEQVFRFLSELEGRDGGTIRHRFYVSPEVITFTPTGPRSYASHLCFQVPYGSMPYTKSELLARQNDVEQGRLDRITVEITGRVDPAFLEWARGSGILSLGPIPDVEILYTLRLPSGAPYTFVLKEARRESQQSANPHERYTGEDWEVIRHFGYLLLSPEHRKNLVALHDFYVEGFPHNGGELQDRLSAIATLEEYVQVRDQWTKGLHAFLRKASPQLIQHPEVDWMDRRFEDIELFAATIESRLGIIPSRYQFRADNFFQLSETEREQFLLRYVDPLFRLCQLERERIASPEEANRHQERIRHGYVGPASGYPLALDYMIMDMIVDFRARRSFVEKRAKERGLDPDSIVVPDHIGRSYERREGFLKIAELPGYLVGRPSSRRVEASFFDPTTNEHIPVEGEPALRAKLEEILLVNVSRIAEIQKAHEASEFYRIGHEHKSDFMRNAPRVASKVLTALRRECNSLQRQLAEAATERSKALAKLANTQAQGTTVGAEAFRSEAAKHDTLITKLKGSSQRAQRALVAFASRVFPEHSRNLFIRLEEIVDSEAARFACSIGADSIPVLSEEMIKRDGKTRRTHSEQLSGRNMYGGGFLLLAKHFEVFHFADAWVKFADSLATSAPRQWRAVRVSNDSGHYFPGPNTLPFTAACLFQELDGAGIDRSQCVVSDALSPGLRAASIGFYRF